MSRPFFMRIGAMLVHAYYVSLKSRHLGDQDEDAILNVAQSENMRQGITGFLLSGEHHFLQLIEGPEREINQLLTNLRADFRHEILFETPPEPAVMHRFHAWSMGYGAVPSGELLIQTALECDTHPTFDTLATRILGRLPLFMTLQHARHEQVRFRTITESYADYWDARTASTWL